MTSVGVSPLNLRIRLGPPERFRNFDQGYLGSRKPRSRSELSNDQLGDKRFHALSGATEFHDEHAAAVRVDDRRKRATFPERLHVSGRCELRNHSAIYPAVAKPEALLPDDRRGFDFHPRLFLEQSGDYDDGHWREM